ncbi:MAG: shikimate dehydrogenase [Negativicutes bacterium]|nr:shikimate dehydrogenase [Negativicutes bacterium]
MTRFAFILHPLTTADFCRKFSLARYVPARLLEAIMRHVHPFRAASIKGVESPWAETEGWFIACPLTARQMIELPEKLVLKKIIQAGRVAERYGADILGLGAFTSVVGDAGITVADNLSIAVTTGNSYTVAAALEAVRQAAVLMDIEMDRAEVAILGASGSIGAALAKILCREAGRINLVARNQIRLEKLARELRGCGRATVRCQTSHQAVLPTSDIVLAVTSAVDSIIEARTIKPGAVVCDVARPRNISREVARQRDDVLVIEGGVVEVPGKVNFGLDFGFPLGMAYACMAETMILALEGRKENFTLGRDLTVSQIEEISHLADKHGFRVAGLRSFERALPLESVKYIKMRAHAGRNGGEGKAGRAHSGQDAVRAVYAAGRHNRAEEK